MARPQLSDEQIEERFLKKGRKALPPAEPVGPDFVGATPPDMAAQEAGAREVLKAAENYREERDLLNQLLGQAQMANAFAKFSKTVFTSKLAFVKENKLYQSLKGSRGENGVQFSGTWEEFCNALGWTPQHANDAIASLNAFGEEALESMSRMGIGYRDLRQYRKLPGDAQLALIEAAKAGDKGEFLDLAEEIIARHSKEKKRCRPRASRPSKMPTSQASNSRRSASGPTPPRRSWRASARWWCRWMSASRRSRWRSPSGSPSSRTASRRTMKPPSLSKNGGRRK